MNFIHSRQSSVNSPRLRRALVQPRFLLATMAFALSGIAYFASAQTGHSPVAMTGSGGANSSPKTLADLPRMVEAYGLSRLAQKGQKAAQKGQKVAQNGLGATRTLASVGNGQSGFNLVEADLTPNSKSDDREPVYSPGGDFIAFASNGKDADNDGRLDSDGFNAEGKYHIWVMNRDGSNVRQVSGLSDDDKTRNQRRPSWSPDGNQLVYIDGDGGDSELYVTEPFTDSDGGTPGTQVGPSSRRTFFNPAKRATLSAPTWSPSGQTIVFAANGNLDNDPGVVGNPFNLFAISPTGAVDTLQRLTGGTGDPTPGTSATTTVDDLNPNFSVVNSNVIYFSSNRTRNGVLGVRRIWRVLADGSGKIQVTDPLQRTSGTANDSDDYPASSLGGNMQEMVAFQTNTSLDNTDVDPNGARDLNIWSLPLSSVFPTPLAEGEPRVFVSEFDGGRVLNANPLNGQPNNAPAVPAAATNPEGVVVQGQFVYVANRGTNQIIRFDQQTGAAVPGVGPGNSFSAVGSVPSPAGLISDGQYFYVAPGINATPVNTRAIYRFTGNGAPAGLINGNGAFSSGDDAAAAKVTNGTEGLTFSAGNNQQFIFTSNYTDNKVNAYRRDNGRFVATFVAPGAGQLNVPTDLTFGPDLNKDGFQDLYVNSSGSDDVKAYAGPNPNDATLVAPVGAGSNVTPGTYLGDLVSDNDGTVTNLNAPEGIDVIQRDDGLIQIFVSSFQNFGVAAGTNTGSGDHINRYTLNPNTIDATSPATIAATIGAQSAPSTFATGNATVPRDATYLTFTGAKGLGYFDFNQIARASLTSVTGMPAPTPTPVPRTTPLEQDGPAQVLTNILSSPRNYAASGIAPQTGTDNVGQDKAPDIEPTFSRITTAPQLSARLSFASTRRFAPLPSSNLTDENGNPPAASNPFGQGTGDTFDIWGTSSVDTTPPALTPQAAGNQLYPVVAPGPQAPFPAPRTAEAGLRPGGKVTVAVVLSELESGVNDAPGSSSVFALFYRAGAEQFTTTENYPDEMVPVTIKTEQRPLVEAGVVLQPYDDGPITKGGHEAQAGAVAGDGLYYCVGTTTTPASAGDFYMDIDATDRAGNEFNYDNIWGFSTQTFAKQSLISNLFVSDYTTGQSFPSQLSNNFLVQDNRFNNEFPSESYYLGNPGGQAFDQLLPPRVLLATSVSAAFPSPDVWRILSRGPVPQTVLDAYKPRLTQQISSDPTADPTFTKKTLQLPVADSYIIWAAPFAANSFVGPGTITDATTQGNLTNFLDAGGRLFVTGRDVAYALSNGASSSNDFLGSELGASLNSEVATNNIDLVGGIANGFILYPKVYPDTYYNLEVADRVPSPATINDLYTDGALTQQPRTNTNIDNGAGVRIDTLTAVGTDATPVYAIGGATVGQKIAHTRANGLQSRVVFFSFGLEGINRRYRKASADLPLVALDTRFRIAAGLTRYFKTNRLVGSVINDKTNLPIPNFLVSVTGGGTTYLARTDTNGNYELSGIPEGNYVIEPAFLLNGKLSTRNTPGAQTDPAGFFGGTPVGLRVTGGVTGTANLRPIPITPGTISGRIVTSKGTPTNFKDDLLLTPKAVGLTVLLRSTSPTTTTKNGGRYAQLTKTNFNGNFTFSNVPAGIALEVVFNPRLDNPATASVDEGDIPLESGLRPNYAGPKLDVGRRVIPDARHPEPVVAPIGNTFVLNDPDPSKFPLPTTGPAAGSADTDKPADSGVPLVIPEGANVTGLVTLNGTPFGGAKVELYSVAADGKQTLARDSTTTSTTGLYSFPDVVAGNYVVRVVATLPDGLEVVQSSPVTKVGVQDVAIDFKLALAQISGLVTLNGKPISGAFVQLLDATGKAIVIKQSNNTSFTLVRTATTDTGSKINYRLANIPPGKYIVKASLTGAAGTASVTVTGSKSVVAPTIDLTPQKLSGVVNLRVDGVSKGGLSGANVELLDSSGKSLSPPVFTVSGANGIFTFDLISAGSYKVRASYKGDTDISATFTLKNGVDPKPTLTINLQTVTVTVFDTQGRPQNGATVTISLGTTVVQTLTTNSAGQVKFVDIAAGTYTVTASINDLSQTASVTVTEGKAATLSLQLVITGSGGVDFGLNGIFPFSLPYATDAGGYGSGVTIDQAFSLPLSSKAYRIFYFNASRQVNNLTKDLVEIPSGSTKLIRGQGYVIQTGNIQVSTRTPMQNTALKAFSGTTFPIPLTWNNTFLSDTFERDNRNNGYNLIGFPFDPARFRTVSLVDAQVTYGSKTYNSINEAAAAGIIERQVYTLNSSGVRVATNDLVLKPYVGYFVHIFRNDQPVKLILRNPK